MIGINPRIKLIKTKKEKNRSISLDRPDRYILSVDRLHIAQEEQRRYLFSSVFIEESITRTLLESFRADRARLLAGLVPHRRTGLPIETPEGSRTVNNNFTPKIWPECTPRTRYPQRSTRVKSVHATGLREPGFFAARGGCPFSRAPPLSSRMLIRTVRHL